MFTDAIHIIEYIEGVVVDSHIVMKLWKERLRVSYLKFQTDFNPMSVLNRYGQELFDLPILYVLVSVKIYVWLSHM